MAIHQTAVIAKEAEIDSDVTIGPFCVIEGNVKIGKGSRLDSNVRVGNDFGTVIIGENNHIFAGAAVGGIPQDLKYKNENTELLIGNGNQIRECVTLNTGTVGGGNKTVIGDNNLFMAYSHLGHDCIVGNANVIANSVSIAGHINIHNHVTVGGMCGLSQFITIGDYAFIAGYSCVNKDILPFSMASGRWATMRATNKVGMERAGFTKAEIQSANQCIRIFSKSGLGREEAIARICEEVGDTKVKDKIIEFASRADRGLAL